MTNIVQILDAKPPEFATKLEDTVATEKSRVKIQVKMDGQPTPDARWFKNGKEVFEGRRVWVEKQGDMTALCISEMRDDDEGDIRCTLTNKHGSISQTAKLSMRGNFFQNWLFQNINEIF